MMFRPITRKFDVPIVRTLYPFFIGGVIVFFGVAKLQNTMINCK
jgi:hypothetical protein